MKWQEQLIRRHPNLFVRAFRGLPFAPGYPVCGDGWKNIVTRLVERVASASKEPAVHFTHIRAEHGILRIHWSSRIELPQRIALAIEEAVALAEARSGCTCVDCGAEGRLFASDFLIFPACDDHQRGTPVPVISGFHDVFLQRGIVRERSVLKRVRYDWTSDAFVGVPPEDLPKKGERHG
jgi:hypothetical protein